VSSLPKAVVVGALGKNQTWELFNLQQVLLCYQTRQARELRVGFHGVHVSAGFVARRGLGSA